MEEEKTIVEEFNVTEKEYEKIWEQFEEADKNNEDLVELIKVLFPNSKEDQIKAYLLHIDGINRGEQEHQCEE